MKGMVKKAAKRRKSASRNRDQYTTVLNGLRSDFRVFGEKLKDVKRRVNTTFEAVGKLQEDTTIVKTDVEFMNGALKRKVDYDEFIILQRRVSRLEAKIARGRS